MISIKQREARRERLSLVANVKPSETAIVKFGRAIKHLVPFLMRRDLLAAFTEETVGRRAVMAAAGAILGARMIPGTQLGSPILGAVLAVKLAAWLEHRERDTANEAALALPDILDRMAVCALAGRSIEQALRIVAKGTTTSVGDPLRRSVAILDAGGTRKEALENLALGESGDVWAAPVAALERADRLGVEVADVLVAQAREQRMLVRALLETQARSAPVKVVFPLVFCFLPAFLLLAIGPVALSALRTLSSF